MTTLDRRERERASRRQEILNAAKMLFAQKDFHEATLDDIAEAAELSKGTIYLYFKNKDDLFFSLMENHIIGLIELMRETLQKYGDIDTLILKVIETHLGYFEKNNDIFKIIHTERGRFEVNIKNEFRKKMINKFLGYIDLLEKVIEDNRGSGFFKDYDSKSIVLALIGMINSFTTQWIMGGQRGSLKTKSGMIYDIFLHGTKKQ
ncbi:TetR/AcrR family transcriptional regulator [candidate division KSB1 bacterium]|nr:TetR/AcrR family transcriptional regulator [candidate division KSB1 bacterium]